MEQEIIVINSSSEEEEETMIVEPGEVVLPSGLELHFKGVLILFIS